VTPDGVSFSLRNDLTHSELRVSEPPWRAARG
jgi:hypothetical protein